MDEENDKTMKEKVEKLRQTPTINFSITKCATDVYQDFTAFCRKEANDSYAFGLKLLLEAMKQNVKETTLYENIMGVKDQLDHHEQRIKALENPPEPERKGPKTMGSKK